MLLLVRNYGGLKISSAFFSIYWIVYYFSLSIDEYLDCFAVLYDFFLCLKFYFKCWLDATLIALIFSNLVGLILF